MKQRMAAWAAVLMSVAAGPATVPAGSVRIDFGQGEVKAGWTGAAAEAYADGRGCGWVGSPPLRFETQTRPDQLRRDFAASDTAATFRVRLGRPGRYRLSVVAGDMRRDHTLTVTTDAASPPLPVVRTRASQYATLVATVDVTRPTLDLTFAPGDGGWAVDGLTVVPVDAAEPPRIVTDFIEADEPAPPDWRQVADRPDPTAPLVAAFLKAAPKVNGTTVDRLDYLRLIESDVDHWRQHQNGDGAIVDPYLKQEWQYSTPCFAFAAAQLAVALHRDDLVEPAARALDWATVRLSQHRAATGHEDFFPPPIAHAMALLKPRVPADRYARWVATLRSYRPFGGYEMAMGSMNWNVVALAGESMFHDLGVRDDAEYVDDSLAAQSHLWASDWGVYGEGPVPYDAWPRLFLADMVHGYRGPYRDAIGETLRRGALTGLFMQSPTGEMPVGQRSSQHVWNEALQCALFEDAAARMPALAGAFKRAAAMSLAAMRQWKRPTGEFQIVHNHVDPADRFGFEIYSATSQYNLMACATLCTAYQWAAATEHAPATVAPAEVGGFVLDLRLPFHTVIASAGGTYVEIDTAGSGHYSPTGLLRVHRGGVPATIGPSDGLVADPSPQYPPGSPTTTAAVGVSWQVNGQWRRLAEVLGDAVHAELTVTEQTPARVAFAIRYAGDLGGPTAIVERYVVTSGRVEQTSDVEGYAGPVRVVAPVLANNGRSATTVDVGRDAVSVRLGDGVERFTVAGSTAAVGPQQYAFRNGWAQLATFDLPHGPATLVVTPGRE